MGQPEPRESEYKDWTDFAEAKLAWQDLESEKLNEKIDFMEGGQQARHRRVTQIMNAGKYPTAWQLSHCMIEYLVDTIINQLNTNHALKEMKEASQKEVKYYEKVMDEEVFPLTKYLSEDAKTMVAAWGKSSPLVALKYIKHLEQEVSRLNSDMPLPPPPKPEM